MDDSFLNVGVPFGGAATSLFAGIRASKQQQKIVAQQIQAQKEENKANRRYNLMLAEKQNRWNLEQWQRNNDYNTPSAVMTRLREAGVNPPIVKAGSLYNLVYLNVRLLIERRFKDSAVE